MRFTGSYSSYLGEILLTADEEGITGLCFSDGKEVPFFKDEKKKDPEAPVIGLAKRWLDRYFSGKEPEFSVPLHLTGTEFEREVWERILLIPYGETVSYGKIAEEIAHVRGVSHFSSRAVGYAASRNPVLLFVPCHRVVRSDGTPGGYEGGSARKRALLNLEKGENS